MGVRAAGSMVCPPCTALLGESISVGAGRPLLAAPSGHAPVRPQLVVVHMTDMLLPAADDDATRRR